MPPHEEVDHNWHAHVLMPTRRFTENGKELGEKAQDMEPQVPQGAWLSTKNSGGRGFGKRSKMITS